VGSRTIVTRDVPPYTIVAGAPGRVLRKRYDEATIELLLESKWWDLPVEQIAPIIPLLTSGNVDALRAALACVKQKQAVCGSINGSTGRPSAGTKATGCGGNAGTNMARSKEP
jgi:hypothetical protein